MTGSATGRRRLVDLSLALVGRDLRISYGGAAFGLLWAPATVIVQVVVLGFVFGRVVPLEIDDYPAFLFTGLAAWQLLSSGIGTAADAFVDNRDLVRRPGFPDIVLPLVTTVRTVAAYLLGLPVLLAVLAASGRLTVSLLALPVVLVVSALVVAGPAFVVATLHVGHRDVGHLTRVVLGVLFYVTPVFYSGDRLPDRYRWVSDLNPLAGVVRLHRAVLYEGAWPAATDLLVTLGFAFVALVIGLAVFGRADAHLADEL